MLKHALFGATLTAAILCAAPVQAQSPQGSVAGSVYDSIAGRALSGARVQLASTTRTSWERSATTDAAGRFHFDSLAFDSYVIGFFDAAADSIGLEPPLKKVEVRAVAPVIVALAIPSARSIIAFNCRNQSIDDGMLLGTVRSSRDRSPIANAKVRVRWFEMSIGINGVERRNPFADATSSANGSFALCGIPADPSSAIQVRAWSGTDSSGFIELVVPRNGLLQRDMYIGASTADFVSLKTSAKDSSTVRVPTVRGTAKLRGVIRSDKGKPIQGAHLSLSGTTGEVLSKEDGTFVLDALPSGTYMLESRAIGFLSSSRVVDVVDAEVASYELTAVPQKQFLDTVRVQGNRLSNGAFDGFERRREAKLGTFLTEDQIKEMRPLVPSDLFRSMRGVFVTLAPGTAGFAYNLAMRSPNSGRCTPSVFVDRQPLLGDVSDLDKVISAREVVAVEVYTDWGSTPAEYMSSTYCGSIVMWTKLSANRRK